MQATITDLIITARIEAIAKAGAKKMSAQGYTFADDTNGVTFIVTNPEGVEYTVNPDTDEILAYCDCPFAKENGLCKHQLWLRDELAHEAADVARWEVEAAERADYEAFGKHLAGHF